jgi:hypothetical protein
MSAQVIPIWVADTATTMRFEGAVGGGAVLTVTVTVLVAFALGFPQARI